MTYDKDQESAAVVSLGRVHTDAVKLLCMPPPSAHVVSMLETLPTNSLRWLWTSGRDGASTEKTDVMAFSDAVTRLGTLPAPIEPVPVATLLNCLGHAWRNLPLFILYRALSALPVNQAPTRLQELELQHVAKWVIAVGSDGADGAMLEWHELVEHALVWENQDEIVLRQKPLRWSHPLESIAAAGFVLTPIISSEQLVAAVAHQRPLCRVTTASSCATGDEAWWFVRPVYAAVGGKAGADTAIGLKRAERSTWTIAAVLAERNDRECMLALAECLATQAQTLEHLARAYQLAQTMRLAPDVRAALAETLQHSL